MGNLPYRLKKEKDIMKFKKMMAGLLAVSVLSIASLTVFAKTAEDKMVISEELPISENVKEEFTFGSFRGRVIKISDFEGTKDAKFISLEDADKMPINMIVSKDTYVVSNDEIKVGDTVTGYFDANAPMILIYPAQYNPQVVVVESEDQQVKVDIFNKDLISADNMLKLNITEDTKIMTQDGNSFKGELAGRKLVVQYSMATKSIPAQTTPTQITVLTNDQTEDVEVSEEKPETKPEIKPEIKPETKPETKPEIKPVGDVSQMSIMVNDKKVNAVSAYKNDKGTVMVPLRPIAEALEFEIVWDGKTETIRVGLGSTLAIGKDEYSFAKMTPMKLGATPTLKDGTTFVPLDFFTEIMQLDQAEVSGSQIIIK